MNSLFAPASPEGTEELLKNLWNQAKDEIEGIDPRKENWKIQSLPLARVKKIMKAEEFVMQELEKDRLRQEGENEEDASKVKFMIAADAPVLMSRACELLIRELTVRSWQHTERNRRRTLQRQDLHAAVGESETFDFLIDIVPRVAAPNRTADASAANDPSMPMGAPDVATQLQAPEAYQDPQTFMYMMQAQQQQLQQQAVLANGNDEAEWEGEEE